MDKKLPLIILLSALLMGCSFAYILTSTPPPPTPSWPVSTNTPTVPTETPMIMCTPPACNENESYHCPDVCLGGCGTVCATHTPENPADWWHPEPGLTFHIQYTGDLDLDHPVDVYIIDLFEASVETISQLHDRNVKVICYFSAGSYEDWQPDGFLFPAEVLGDPLEGWAGEFWLDIRRIDLLGPIMQARLDMAAAKGCDAVDPDNLDGYENEPGFDLTGSDQLTYNRWLAGQAHDRGLAIGLKNDLRQIPDLIADFDFAVNEECFSYQECGPLAQFTDANKAVFAIEYGNDAGEYCAIANATQFMLVRKNLDLDAWNIPCWDD